ncbi:MAG TPA: dihydrofolate reductase family protein [Sphingomicrobium sp.]
MRCNAVRKIIYGGAVSLDGFLAGPGEALDWLRWSDDAAAISKASFAGVDAMLMGRKTAEFAWAKGGGPPTPGVTTYVFSRTLDQLPQGATGELVRADAVDFVRAMKSAPGGNILVMGGGELGTALIEGGLVDEIGFSIHPVVLGGGVPALCPMTRRVELELIEARPIARECVLVRYRVVN